MRLLLLVVFLIAVTVALLRWLVAPAWSPGKSAESSGTHQLPPEPNAREGDDGLGRPEVEALRSPGVRLDVAPPGEPSGEGTNAGTLEVLVVDDEDRPLPEISVSFLKARGELEIWSWLGDTDEGGRFRRDGLEPAAHTLLCGPWSPLDAWRADTTTSRIVPDVIPGSGSVKVVLGKAARLRGSITPIPTSRSLELEWLGPPSPSSLPSSRVVPLDDDGAFEIPLAMLGGPFDLELSTTDALPLELDALVLEAGEIRDLGPLRFPIETHLGGRVVSDEGVPVEGAVVSLVGVGARWFSVARTGRDGMFSASQVPDRAGVPGSVRIRADGYLDHQERVGDLLAIGGRTFPLSRASQLQGKIHGTPLPQSGRLRRVGEESSASSFLVRGDGSFELSDVPPGDYELILQSPHQAWRGPTVQLQPGVAGSVTVWMDRATKIQR